MTAGSSVVAVKAALITTLQARSGLSGVPVTDGGPIRSEDLQNDSGAYEAIWFGNTTWVEYNVPFLGTPVTIDEVYDVDVVLQVLKVGEHADTQTATDSRVMALLGEVVGALCAAPDLGIAVASGITVFDALPHANDQTGGWLAKGDEHGSRLDLKVRVNARLQLT